jgi:hypothetical protein
VNVPAINAISSRNKKKLFIGIFLFLLAIPLSVVEIKQCIAFIVSGKTPEIPTLIFALDLSTVVPTTILLWKNHPWGSVLGMMMLVKAFAYGLVLVTSTLLITSAGMAAPDPLLPFYSSLVIGGLLFGYLLFIDLKPLAAK